MCRIGRRVEKNLALGEFVVQDFVYLQKISRKELLEEIGDDEVKWIYGIVGCICGQQTSLFVA